MTLVQPSLAVHHQDELDGGISHVYTVCGEQKDRSRDENDTQCLVGGILRVVRCRTSMTAKIGRVFARMDGKTALISSFAGVVCLLADLHKPT